MVSTLYTNGVIAVKEKLLLGEKLLRFPEMTAEEVLRVLTESGFGDGESQEGELVCRAEEEALDAFIREYASSKAELDYLLSPRDFHNAKALCKAAKIGSDSTNLLAPEGLIPIEKLKEAIQSETHGSLNKDLAGAIDTVLKKEDISGAEIGAIFDNAQNHYLLRALTLRPLLRHLLAERTDRTNILTALRASSFECAKPLFIKGGKLGKKTLEKVCNADMGAGNPLKGTPYEEFLSLCMRAKDQHLPFTEAERALESAEAEYFREKRYELEGKEPFLYYVFRRRAEIANVRIILVCLGAGMPPYEIKKRLRAI